MRKPQTIEIRRVDILPSPSDLDGISFTNVEAIEADAVSLKKVFFPVVACRISQIVSGSFRWGAEYGRLTCQRELDDLSNTAIDADGRLSHVRSLV